jgi:MraZ protein
MRFIGTHQQTVDPKGRVALPAKFRRLLSPEDQEAMVLTIGREACLLLYPQSEWNRVADALDALPRNKDRRQAIRAISDNTQWLELDSNGRVTIPRAFLDQIEAEREVTMVGSLRYIEVWSRQRYDEDRDTRRTESSDILDRIF